jgi:PIN domain nuclease of toxin-antitoxin system
MILLDTHILVWFVSNPEKLSQAAIELVHEHSESGVVNVSAISVWELAMLEKKQRLKLSMPVETWLNKIESLPFISFIPVDNAIAIRSVQLPEPLHKDPADRIIAATAIGMDLTLVTKDERLLRYAPVHTVW